MAKKSKMAKKYKYDNRKTLKALFNEARNFSLVLPDFQRGFVWDPKKDQKPLLQSMLAEIPIGSILLLTDKKDSYSSRPLCFGKSKARIGESESTCTFLLDGQQRMSTLKSIFYDLFDEKEIKALQKNKWQDLWDDLPSRLRYRWFLKIDVDGDNDIWGLQKLEFKETHNDRKPFSPADFEDYIKYEKIHKTKSLEYGPDKSIGDLVGWAADKKLVPLYLLGTDFPAAKNILEQIASNKHIKSNMPEQEKKGKIKKWVKAVSKFLMRITLNIKIPSITLEGQPGMEVGIYIFEQVNRGGVKLDIYDLLVARVALHRGESGENLNLTKQIKDLCSHTHATEKVYQVDIESFDARNMHIWDEKNNIPASILKKAFKNCLAICNLQNRDELHKLSTKHIKENNLLDLTAEEIYNNWEQTILTLFSVMQFLHFRCGVVKLKDIPYELLVIPLFVFFLKHKNCTKKDIDKIEYWYWASIFCGHYREKQSTRVIDDSKEIIKNKEFYKEFSVRANRIFQEGGYSDIGSLTRKKSNSRQPPLDNAIIQYVLAREPWDLMSENNNCSQLKAYYFANNNIALDRNLHHIIPINEIAKDDKKEASKIRKDLEHPINSVLNKVLISQKANWRIQRISDYENPQYKRSCGTNLIPSPTDEDYMKQDEPYALDNFLSNRFRMIKEDVENHLKMLKEEPPIR